MSKYVKRLRGEKCEVCGVVDWQGQPLTFQVDHVDGNRTNNSLDNLRVLCPNCHSQTDTYGHKNISEEGKNIQRLNGLSSKQNKVQIVNKS